MGIFPKKRDDSNVKDSLDSKYHYESVLEYFKYLVTVTIVFITLIGGVITYMTYGSLNEMKDDLKEKTKDLKDEFTEKNKKMEEQVNELKLNADKTIQETKDKALREIYYVRDDARKAAIFAANKQIELVFEKNNIDSFIIKVAKRYVEPQIATALEREKMVEIDSAIIEIKSGDYMKIYEGVMILSSNPGYKLTDSQQTELINLIKGLDDNSQFKSSLIDVLIFQNSKKTTDFFEYTLTECDNLQIVTQGINYLIKNDKKPDYKVFSNAIDVWGMDIISIFLEQAIKINRKSILPFLDSHEIVNALNKKLTSDELEYIHSRTETDLLQYFKKEQLENIYFFQKSKK